ncbi:hypothetical protein CEXT_257831 [Caerostris extrusa]|uniref:Ribosomal protein L2 n=1 Tax=Caerostris extrusa TaxID=172846 RepID=A0AAV4XHN8_CAEEX|nr:hypothetical protein CEXT_257831 [Caerostris extrusa]
MQFRKAGTYLSVWPPLCAVRIRANLRKSNHLRAKPNLHRPPSSPNDRRSLARPTETSGRCPALSANRGTGARPFQDGRPIGKGRFVFDRRGRGK